MKNILTIIGKARQGKATYCLLGGWRSLALISYVWIALMGYFIVYLDRQAININIKYYLVSIGEFVFFVLAYICPKLLRYAKNIIILPEEISHQQAKKFFFTSWLACFAVFLVMYITFYPGAFSPDSISQYAQASGIKNYNDWHPVLHTLFAFTLPLRLTGGWTGSIILFQVIVFSLALAYMSYTLAEYGNIKYALLVLLYIMLNPATLSIAMYPWKDVSFAVFAMLSTTFAARIYFTNGKWLNSPAKIFLFSVVLACTTIFRHNAILFTLPILFFVMLNAERKANISVAAVFCITIFLIKAVLYPYVNAQKPGYRIVETTCAPMTIIADAVQNSPKKVDDDIAEFLYSVAPKQEWDEHYKLGTFNSIKFRSMNWNIIEEAGYIKIFGMMFKCLKEAPFASVRSFLALTDMVWGIIGPTDWGVYPDVIPNNYGIEPGGITVLQFAFKTYNRVTRVLLKYIFWHTGILCLVLFVFSLAKLDFSKPDDRKKLVFVLSLFLYDFGTMLFLGGNDFRFFYCTYLIAPVILFMLIAGKQ